VSEIQRFMFEGLPVRGLWVRLDSAWQELLQRQAQSAAYPQPVRELLGQMCAAALLLQASIKFSGALQLQLVGEGPVRLAVAETRPDGSFRATAQLAGSLPEAAAQPLRADGSPTWSLADWVNRHGGGRCALTLEPQERSSGQQSYQGVVPLSPGGGAAPFEHLSQALEHYMQQSEQIDTRLVLAANDQVAAGLLIQRVPASSEASLSGAAAAQARREALERSDDYPRIALLAASLQRDELLTLDADTVLRRLFWQEPLQRLQADAAQSAPRFACRCSRAKVAAMLQGLGVAEVESILAERAQIEVGCEFCGAQYRFDAVDSAQLFAPTPPLAAPTRVH